METREEHLDMIIDSIKTAGKVIPVESVTTVVKSLPMRETLSKAVEPIKDSVKDVTTSTLGQSTLSSVSSYIPVLGSAYGVVKTCVNVYNATSPANAVLVGVKGVLIDCTPPIIKYPALCAAIAGCTAGACITGDPNFFIGALECTKSVIKK